MSIVLLEKFILSQYPEAESILEKITERFIPFQYEKGESFLNAGEVCHENHFLSEGVVRSFALDPEGNEVTTGLHIAPTAVFDITSFFTRTPSMEYFQCITACHGYKINFQQLNSLFHTYPQFREFGRLLLVKSNASLKERSLSFITQTAEQRYVSLLEKKPLLFQHVPLKYIASYLGITDTSLSRIRKQYSS